MTGFPNLGSSKKTSSSLSQLPMLIPHCTLWAVAWYGVGRLLSEQGCVETRKGNNQEKTQRDPENTDAESTLSNNHKAQLLVPILQMQRPRPEEEK